MYHVLILFISVCLVAVDLIIKRFNPAMLLCLCWLFWSSPGYWLFFYVDNLCL